MPELQEVFRMATQKVRPEPGALERQFRGQRRRSTRRKAAVYALMAGFVALVVILFTSLPRGGDRTSPPADQQEPTGLEPGAYALDLATGSTTRLPGDTGGWTEFDASPDGSELAFTSNATGT